MSTSVVRMCDRCGAVISDGDIRHQVVLQTFLGEHSGPDAGEVADVCHACWPLSEAIVAFITTIGACVNLPELDAGGDRG